MNLAINLTMDEKAERMEARLAFRSVFNCIPIDIYRKVDRVQHRARSRKLDQSDVMLFIEDIVQMISIGLQHNIQLTKLWGRLDGGSVSNSYGYSGKSTQIHIDGHRLIISRDRSRSTAGGDDGHRKVGFTDLDNDEKRRLKALGWTGAGGFWRPA